MSVNLETLLQQISGKLDVIIERMDAKTEPACKYTLFAWLTEWEQSYRSPKLRDSGYALRMNINNHIKPNIVDKPLNEYSAHDITVALSAVRSERMRQIVRQIYKQSFREAVRAGFLDHNPVDNVEGVKHAYRIGHALTVAQQSELLSVTANDMHSALYRFYLLTGARPSEPFTIKWSDVTDNTIRIPGTKTVRADRVLPLSSKLKELLDSMQHVDERVFPYAYQAVMRHFIRMIRPALSFDMTIKDLRHTFATRCAEAGISIKTVQKWMGHSNFGTTANIYSHVTTELERSELEKLNGSGVL